MTDPNLPGHPPPDTIAAFAEGRLKRAEMPELLAHLEGCEDCMTALEIAGETAEEEGTATGTGTEPRNTRWWLLAAAAVLVAVMAIPLAQNRLQFASRSAVARLAALAPPDARVIEPRLSVGFAWAPYRGPVRASAGGQDTRQMKLAGVAGELVDRANADTSSAAAQHDAGIALLAIEEPLQAIDRLRTAATLRQDARAWSDLAAAQYAAALRLERPALYAEALASADLALRRKAQLPEALFNRALILERMGLAQEARAAWQRYLEIDPSSPWAREAESRLSRLPEQSGDALFREDVPRLESAAARGDRQFVTGVVSRFPEQARAWGEAEYLGRWGEAVRANDGPEAERLLAIARVLGDVLTATSGESLLRDAVRAVDAAGAERLMLAEGHAIYRRGRIAYSRQQPTVAEPDLRRAATLFAANGSPMSLMARYYAANVRFDGSDAATARGELEVLIREAASHSSYHALGALARWQLAVCLMVDADWGAVLPLLGESAAAFRQLGERNNLGFVETLTAHALSSAGSPDAAWAARIRSFELLSRDGRGDRLVAGIHDAADAEVRNGCSDCARSLLRVEESLSRTAGNDVLLADALSREALLDATHNDMDLAMQKLAEATVVTRRIPDAKLRARRAADLALAEGAARWGTDPRTAEAALTRAVTAYREMGVPLFLPDAYLLRARARNVLGDAAGSADDVDHGIREVTRHPVAMAGSVTGTSVLRAGPALFEEAVRASLARGDFEAAFAYADASHARLAEPVQAAEVQQRLLGSGTAVLELFALPHEVVAFCITEREMSVARQSLWPGKLARLVEEQDEQVLYDLLIRPSERALDGAEALIVVPDEEMADLPFAALFDRVTSRYLVERFRVAVAISAASLRPAGPPAPRSLLGVTLPSLQSVAALPETSSEVNDVALMYGRSRALSGPSATFAAFLAAATDANTIHVAGHTERQPGIGDAALVFAGGDRVTWRSAASRALPHSVVVLAACETLRTPHAAQTRALSLGAGFIAGGVAEVVGTLAPIADVDARELFRSIHRQLAAGVGTAEAVHRAQLEAVARDRRGAWRSIALLTTRIDASRREL